MADTRLSGILNEGEETILRQVGFEAPEARSATAVLVDHTLRVAPAHADGVEILSIQDALMRYDFVQDLMFNMISADESELLRQSAELLHDPIGHFVHVHPGVKLDRPIQTFTLMERPQERQFTHNITVIGEGAEVDIIAGAAVPQTVHTGHHVSIDEAYMHAGSSCRTVSVERWGRGMAVDSFARTHMAAGAQTVSNAIMLAPLRHHLSDSKTVLLDNARANDQSVIFAPEGSSRHFELEVRLAGPGARSEHVARMVSAGGSIINNNLLIGEAPDTSGFLGCDGLLLSNDGEIIATPSLSAKSINAQLSHEASVGMIDSQKLDYLMASGLGEDDARDLIVQGFLRLKDDTIPPEMRAAVREMIAAAQSGGM
ncbi:MAG: SufD family Fe-S cluster assembly protein [Pseudomonadota bacterium]